MEKVNARQRLAFVRQDVARLLEELPTELLITPIEGFENLGTILSNIAVACDEEDQEPKHWIVTWYEVFLHDDEEGTHTLATFDTEKQAKDFMYDYSMRYPEVELYYDEWQSNTDGSGVARRNPILN